MPSKKKKYNARFPAGRIKKIMQTDEEIGKVAQAVPVIISRTLELFVESLLSKSNQITLSRNAKTLTPSHMKQCILSESRFDFLRDLVKNVPDASTQEDNENNAIFEASQNSEDMKTSYMDTDSSSPSPKPEMSISIQPDQPSSSSSSTNRMPVIKYGPKVTQEKSQKPSSTIVSKKTKDDKVKQVAVVMPIPQLVPAASKPHTVVQPKLTMNCDNIPPLVPITSHNFYVPNSGDNLCIDEDYDN